MIDKQIISEGHGRDFSWWEEKYKFIYVVATSEDLKLNLEYNYSKEEIEKLSQNKQIIPFGGYFKAV